MKRLLAVSSWLVFAVGCAYGPGPVGDYSIAGTVRGLNGSGALVSDASGASVFVAADGRFVIENAFADGAAYDVDVEAVLGQESTRCTVERGVGVIRAASVDDVAIVCRPRSFTVSGRVRGLTTYGLILESRGEAITLAKDGRFTFFAPVTTGSSYTVTIAQEPAGETCRLAHESGIVTDDVDDVTVTCEARDIGTAADVAAPDDASP